MTLTGQVALVTGGAVGIGEGICRALVAEGARVAINYNLSSNSASALAEEIGSNGGGEVMLFKADVRDSEQVEKMVCEIADKHGRIDILVNNAGVIRDNLILAMSDEDWNNVHEVNLKGAFNCIREVGRLMIQQRSGRIVNISSISAARGGKGQANYASSKAALNALTRVAALELAAKGINVNAVAPGVVDTKMSGRVRQQAGDRLLRSIPLGRYGKPEDVVRLVMFLVSRDANYITGEVIAVNGGLGL